MRILITGAEGQLGKSIITFLEKHKLFLLNKKTGNILDKNLISNVFNSFKPEIVFHFASLTKGDECARNPELAYEINVQGTINIVDLCKKHDAPILFVSTNEVFDGTKNDYYIETDLPNPITVVGKTKFEAENYIKNNLNKYFIVRTMWLYSKWSSNFLHAIINKVKNTNEITLVSDEIGSPTSSADLSKAILKLIEKNQYGIYHLVNEGKTSRLEFGTKILELMNMKAEIKSISLKDFDRVSKPPLFSALKNLNAKKLNVTLPPWEKALEQFILNNKHIFNT